MEWERDGYVVSDDPARLDVERVWRWLAEESYWATGRARDVVERAIAGSVNLGLYRPDAEPGRLLPVGDRRSDVRLAVRRLRRPGRAGERARHLDGRAGGRRTQPSQVRRQMLATADAHGLYAKFGFTPLSAPDRWMEHLRSGT